MAYQRAYFPMKTINVSQTYGVGTHKYSYALDLSGKDTGKDEVYAPFDCKVTKVYCPKGKSYEVWLESTKKVLSPNGYYGYLTISITHPSEIANMRVGTIYKQGQLFCYEGREGGATGNHIHLEVSKGKNCSGWDVINRDNKTYYVNKNRVKPEEYLFLREDSTIRNTRGVKMVKESDIIYKVCEVPSEPLLIHSKKDFSNRSLIDKKGLKNGNEVIKFNDDGRFALIYHYERLGYVSSKYLKK